MLSLQLYPIINAIPVIKRLRKVNLDFKFWNVSLLLNKAILSLRLLNVNLLFNKLILTLRLFSVNLFIFIY